MPGVFSQCSRRFLIGAGWLLACAGVQPTLADDETPRNLEIAGYVERVQIAGTDIVLDGRLDTGAGLSSLNALDLESFERDDDDWVRFDIVDPDDEDERITLEYPVERTVRIIRHSGNHQERYVVRLGLCVAGHHRVEEVSLTDRSELTYQVLVGRNHMESALLVDPAERFLQEPECPADLEELPRGGVVESGDDGDSTADEDQAASRADDGDEEVESDE